MKERFGYDNAARVRDMVVQRAKEHGFDPEAIDDVIALGSGLDGFADSHLDRKKAGDPSGPVVVSLEEAYDELQIPRLSGRVTGHARELVINILKGTDESRLALAINGREHPYETKDTERSAFPVRVGQLLRGKTLTGSNAAGVITPQTLKPGDIMMAMGHMDLNADNPLRGENDPRLGVRFPHMAGHYPRTTRDLFKQVAAETGLDLKEGIYVREVGPMYEPKELIYLWRFLIKGLWGEARQQPGEVDYDHEPTAVVGMSSTYEVVTAQHARLSGLHSPEAFQDGVAYFSVATNWAAALHDKGIGMKLDHAEVAETASRVKHQFGELVSHGVQAMRDPDYVQQLDREHRGITDEEESAET